MDKKIEISMLWQIYGALLTEKQKEYIDYYYNEELAMDLFNYVLDVASGRKVKAEEAGFHDMAIFKQGVTL